MILVGIDDTDTLDSPGTNQVARGLVSELPAGVRCFRIVRHQLLFDPRVPYTSKNGSCSIWLEQVEPSTPDFCDRLFAQLRRSLLARFQPGSDPGLCLTLEVPAAVVAYGWRCKVDLVEQHEARRLAAENDLLLEGLGGTEGGVIGALAAVGLAATGDDGRVVRIGSIPDDLHGFQTLETLTAHGVDEVRCRSSGLRVTSGLVDVGKHLRPNLQGGRIVLFAEPLDDGRRWRGLKLV